MIDLFVHRNNHAAGSISSNLDFDMDSEPEVAAVTTTTASATSTNTPMTHIPTSVTATNQPNDINSVNYSKSPNGFKTSVAKNLDFDSENEPNVEITTKAISTSTTTTNLPITELLLPKRVTDSDQLDNSISKTPSQPKVSTNLDFVEASKSETETTAMAPTTTTFSTPTVASDATTIATTTATDVTEPPRTTMKEESSSTRPLNDPDIRDKPQLQNTTESNQVTKSNQEPLNTENSLSDSGLPIKTLAKPTFDPNLSYEKSLKPNIGLTSSSITTSEVTTIVPITDPPTDIKHREDSEAALATLNEQTTVKPRPALSFEKNLQPNVEISTVTSIGEVTEYKPTSATNSEKHSGVAPVTENVTEKPTEKTLEKETESKPEKAAESEVTESNPTSASNGEKHSDVSPVTENATEKPTEKPTEKILEKETEKSAESEVTESTLTSVSNAEEHSGIAPAKENSTEIPTEKKPTKQPEKAPESATEKEKPIESATEDAAVSATETNAQNADNNNVMTSTPSSAYEVTSYVIIDTTKVSTTLLVPSTSNAMNNEKTDQTGEEKLPTSSSDITTQNPENSSNIFSSSLWNVLSLLVIISICNLFH